MQNDWSAGVKEAAIYLGAYGAPRLTVVVKQGGQMLMVNHLGLLGGVGLANPRGRKARTLRA